MTIDPTCIHGLVLRWCSLCRPRQPAPKEPIQATFSAPDSSLCAFCRQRIETGDVVQKLMPSGDVVHEYCPW